MICLVMRLIIYFKLNLNKPKFVFRQQGRYQNLSMQRIDYNIDHYNWIRYIPTKYLCNLVPAPFGTVFVSIFHISAKFVLNLVLFGTNFN